MSATNVWQHHDEDLLADAADRLRELFPIGSEVSLVPTHVSRSGMRRVIKVMVYDKRHKRIVSASSMVARVLGWKIDHDHGGGVVVDGAGMDMGFHLVYSLSRALYRGSRSKKINGDAGYALNLNYV